MQDFTFTGLWPQTEGNPLATFDMTGVSPVDALLKRWATGLPDTEMSTPMRCEQDGHTYHMRLNERGEREITITAVPEQWKVETI
jgi:hypothetical protein